MKTQIIHLESHDDTNSVKDKMDWSQTPRVLLIWPDQTEVLTERLDLVLLERHSTAMGSQLALVSPHPEVIEHAREIGIPVFSSKKDAQNSPWHRSRRFYQRRKIQENLSQPREGNLHRRPPTAQDLDLPQWAQLTVFTVGVFAVLFIATLFLPRAKINIPPQDQWQEMVIPIRSSPDLQKVHVSGVVPAQKIFVSIEKRAQKPATGTLAIPDTHAAGSVLITNLTDHDLTLPQNTVLSAYGPQTVRYRTLEPAELPGQNREEPVEVHIKSLEPGVKGNQPAGTDWGVSATIGADLTVQNPQPISGGRDVYVAVPTRRDKQILEEKVIEELKGTAHELLQQKIKPDDVLLTEDPILEEIEEKQFSPEEGEPGETLELTIRISFSGWVVKSEDLQTLAREVMSASQRSDKVRPVPSSLVVQHHTPPPDAPHGETEWKLALKWRQEPVIENQDIIRLALGQNPSRAKARISQAFDLETPVQISNQPPWWPRLPFIPFRIEIQ